MAYVAADDKCSVMSDSVQPLCASGFFTAWATRETQNLWNITLIYFKIKKFKHFIPINVKFYFIIVLKSN